MTKEPNFDVAHLAHVEIYSPKPDETLWFLKEPLGMEEASRSGQSVYLRAYEDFYHHTLKITEAKERTRYGTCGMAGEFTSGAGASCEGN